MPELALVPRSTPFLEVVCAQFHARLTEYGCQQNRNRALTAAHTLLDTLSPVVTDIADADLERLCACGVCERWDGAESITARRVLKAALKKALNQALAALLVDTDEQSIHGSHERNKEAARKWEARNRDRRLKYWRERRIKLRDRKGGNR